ncbi:DinB family protein [Pedobacter antarcticus]|uniref:DinB family protein n=1 Tax=Pedobacter antarcticus TaxID=34086 RepID=UPI001C56F2B6|nr:DinB family protein [Pedobacter antarcticus]
MNNPLDELENIINNFPDQIQNLSEEDLNYKPSPAKWSKKEIIGHLIDSALINYQRFIRAQSEENPQIFYAQNDYCECADYQNSAIPQLINLWSAINNQLLFLMKSVTQKNLTTRKCNDLTLDFLIQDYVSHFNHHKHQIMKN